MLYVMFSNSKCTCAPFQLLYIIKEQCTNANIRGLVWFDSGRNKLMQLLIWAWNIFGHTVQTLYTVIYYTKAATNYNAILID